MAKGVTTIGHDQSELRIYVSTRGFDQGDSYKDGILIEQGIHCFIDDVILVDSEDRAKQLINAIKRRGADLGWEI
jgi:hypothetical protein